MLGRGEAIRYDQRGKRAGKAGVDEDDRAFLVGTFGVKLGWYGFLRESVKWHLADEESRGPKPKGLIHIGRDVPEDWTEQVTAETITTKKRGLGTVREWTTLPGRQNHYLDCRVYNRAAAEKLLLDRLSDEDWERLLADRHGAGKPDKDDTKPSEDAAPKGGGEDWLGAGDDYWR